MLAPFPHRYCASLCRTYASRARIEAPPRPALHGGPPPELDGDVDAWSPEHMLLSSLGLCMLTTFEAFAARDGIELLAWCAQVHGTVEQTPEGPTFTSIVLELDIDIAGNVDQFEDTLEDAKRYCLVQNALRVPVVVETAVRTPCDPLRTADDDIALRPRLPHDGRALHAM
jgi:organic hydroperoxide reductase OsmC/OhrA